MGLKVAHVGVVVSPDGLEAAVARYGALGFKVKMHVRRAGSFIGDIVGKPGADIEIVHMALPGEDTQVEILAYHKKLGLQGTQHIAFWADEEPQMPGWSKIGSSTVPDGPNKGMRASYWRGQAGDIVEIMVKPK